MAINNSLIVLGDRVLIEPDEGEIRTEVGLYLPKWALEKETVQGGFIAATGPGIPLPSPNDVANEPWETTLASAQFVPMQVEVGDYAIFLRKSSIEIKFEGKNYLVVPQSGILVIERK